MASVSRRGEWTGWESLPFGAISEGFRFEMPRVDILRFLIHSALSFQEVGGQGPRLPRRLDQRLREVRVACEHRVTGVHDLGNGCGFAQARG